MRAFLWGVVLFLWLGTAGVWADPADVQYLSAGSYTQAVLEQIDGAASSIEVFLYTVSAYPNQPQSPGFRILRALVRAKQRGVAVKVVLDQTQNPMGNRKARFGLVDTKNQRAYEYLKSNEVPVFYDDASRYTHAKLIVIDRKIVVLGSSNWTNAGLGKNNEANILIRSSQTAEEILHDFDKIQTQPPAFFQGAAVPIPEAFLGPTLLGTMVTRGSERAFDIYLYLLKERNPDGPTLNVDHDALAKYLGIEWMKRSVYRGLINRSLRELRERYHLLELATSTNQDATVTFTDPPGEGTVLVPRAYWNYGWSRSLSLSGRTLALLSLAYAQASKSPPRWRVANKILAKRHGISMRFISEGITELRRNNLMEVRYDSLDADHLAKRRASVHIVNPFHDPKALQKGLDRLIRQYGAAKVDRAKDLAALVYEDSDLEGIRTLIQLEEQYGPAVLQEAAAILRLKKGDNPKRTLGYLIQTIRRMGEGE